MSMDSTQGSICQSCGMPLREEKDRGTNSDGTRSADYCFHCYQDGAFLDEGISLQDKIEKNVRFGIQRGMSEDSARAMCEDILPTLKRWKHEP